MKEISKSDEPGYRRYLRNTVAPVHITGTSDCGPTENKNRIIRCANNDASLTKLQTVSSQ